jgi:hypothetical protein
MYHNSVVFYKNSKFYLEDVFDCEELLRVSHGG